MTNPFQSSAAVGVNSQPTSLAVTVLLVLLATITTYLFWSDINYFLAAQKGTLTKAGSISFLHHIYLTMFPLEVAFFRLATSASVFIFIVFSIRNKQTFANHVAPLYLYGITQLAFYILSMSAILGILNQVSGNKLLEISYWSGPTAKTLVTSILLIISMHLLPPAAFLFTCYAARSRINKQLKPSSSTNPSD
ncbi:hypothetical protein SAMN05216600_116116 [Pseudomonas cuatrocienegasensis]|uniref:Uncharacterized protein n=1 Tax=Pseudomonas cuatrocienegasensis TaxID=543360 RepID=A0ABY1BM97_9PSED|nr:MULTISPECIES: hypothetical protein [Pseudomonas]SER17014.1 hypothetical protein SAMN05216600_116116 [Pseudomonas cuatrocienegasensis]